MNASMAKMRKLINFISAVTDVPKTSMEVSEDRNKIEILNENKFVPDFTMLWDTRKEQYKVYIRIGGRGYEKDSTGYCMFTVNSRLSAIAFVTIYGLMFKHRANNKEEAFAS